MGSCIVSRFSASMVRYLKMDDELGKSSPPLTGLHSMPRLWTHPSRAEYLSPCVDNANTRSGSTQRMTPRRH